MVICTTLGVSLLNLESEQRLARNFSCTYDMFVPLRIPLSSNSFPKLINLIELGLAGFVSHSSLHSRNISSFNLYTLRLNGSLFGTDTARFIKYLLSSLNGCRAPLVNRRVISSVGPAASLVASLEGGRGRSASEEGPIAVDCNRERYGAEGWEGSEESCAEGSCVVMSCVASDTNAEVTCVWPDCDVLGATSGGFVAKLLISNGVDEGASSALPLRFEISRGEVRVSSGVVSAVSFEAMIGVRQPQQSQNFE